MAKNKNKGGKKPAGSKELYVLVRPLALTLPEELIFGVIPEMGEGGISDADIAEALALRADEVDTIIGDEGLTGVVEGGPSRRTRVSGVTLKEYLLVDRHGKSKLEGPRPCTAKHEKFFNGMPPLMGGDIPHDVKKHKPEICRLWDKSVPWKEKLEALDKK